MSVEQQNDDELIQLQKEIIRRTQQLRRIMDDQKITEIQQITQRRNNNNFNGELSYPKYQHKISYYQQFWKIYLLNQMMIVKLKDFSSTNKTISNQIQSLQDMQKQWTNIQTMRTKKKIRRTSDMIEKNFMCPFPKCGKYYGTDVSLNLHMKIKHQSGTKTQRQMLAKQLVLAQERGQKLQVNLNFPPGYLQQFRESFKK